jgi:endogenous inhibitor of DNA gyrase (YacG/DUF329 family)
METVAHGKRIRQCPQCGVKLTRYEWSKLWWMSGLMSGKLVQPCAECGTRLRMSSMALVSSGAAIGLIGTSVSYALYQEKTLLFIMLSLLLVLLISLMATRIESVPSAAGVLDPPPERINKKRL